MSLTVKQLEELMATLQELESRLRETDRPKNGELSEHDPLVRMAEKGEFFMPTPLTVESLKATVRNKINNVRMLMERAKENEQIPSNAKAVMENEYLLVDVEGRDVGDADRDVVKSIQEN